MSPGSFNAVAAQHQTHTTLPAYKLRQLGLFWLIFCAGLVVLAGLLMRSQANNFSEPSPQRGPGKSSRGVLFDVRELDTPTPLVPTNEPTVTPGEEVTIPPTDTPVPTRPAPTATDMPPTPIPTWTKPPVDTDTPAPTSMSFPTSTPFPTETPPPTTPPTPVTPPTIKPTDTPPPIVTKQATLTNTPMPISTVPTVVTKPSPATFTPIPPTRTPLTPKPTTNVVEPTDPAVPATAITQPTATKAPTITNTPVPTRRLNPTPTPRRRITNTPAVIVPPSPTVDVASTREAQANATATSVTEQVIVVATAQPEASATLQPTPTSALTEYVAKNPNGPILIYTYTQQLKPDGNHLVAACVLNIGNAPASDVDAAFNAKSPAVITGLRIPSELSSREAKRATVRIASLSPKFMKQLEVSVGSVDIPMPEWISVTITRAYALNHAGDPAFPVKCEPEGVDAVTSDVKEVTLSVGPYRAMLEQVEQIRQANGKVIVIGDSTVGPAISLSALQCVVGWIGFCSALLLLLIYMRRKRRQQLQIPQM